MSLTPSEHDVAAGYTETLMAVAVIRYPDLGEADIPWIELGGAGIGWPGDVDSWLRHDVPGWDDHDINYAVYVVPEAD